MHQPPTPRAGDGPPPIVLVVEDDPVQIGLYRAVLRDAGWTLRWASTLGEADAALEDGAVAAVVLDLLLPDGDGRTWLARLRERPEHATLPVIVVAGTAGLEAQVDCYALGAAMLVKPVEPRVLLAAVGGALERTRRRHDERLVDEQTGLQNRAGLLEALRRARDEEPLALALLEPDGHPPRVELPRTLGALAALAVGSAGALAPGARWSETMVAVLIPGTAEEAGGRLGHARAQAGSGALPFSAGVATVASGAAPADVVAAAERDLTTARLAGGDRVSWPGSAATEPPPAPVILIADDDEVVAALLEHRLEREGFVVERARDGLEALQLASERPFSLGIFDILMPGMDGFELLERVRAMPRHARTPIMILTGLGGERDVERALGLGADDFVIKPFSPVELTARINRLLRDA